MPCVLIIQGMWHAVCPYSRNVACHVSLLFKECGMPCVLIIQGMWHAVCPYYSRNVACRVSLLFKECGMLYVLITQGMWHAVCPYSRNVACHVSLLFKECGMLCVLIIQGMWHAVCPYYSKNVACCMSLLLKEYRMHVVHILRSTAPSHISHSSAFLSRQTTSNPVVMLVKPEQIQVHELKPLPNKAKVQGMVAMRQPPSSGEPVGVLSNFVYCLIW